MTHFPLFSFTKETSNEPSTSSEKAVDRTDLTKPRERREIDPNEAVLDLMDDLEQLEEVSAPGTQSETKFIVTLDGVEDDFLRSLERAAVDEERDEREEVCLNLLLYYSIHFLANFHLYALFLLYRLEKKYLFLGMSVFRRKGI